jgi:hypothetical protein
LGKSEQKHVDKPAATAQAPAESELRSFAACYNPACADYRRRREPQEPCSCRKRSVRDPIAMHDYEF